MVEGDIETKRDLELENIAGNLMIAQYQVDKLQYRQVNRLEVLDMVLLVAKKHLHILSSIMANGTRFQLR
jgi:hypothetical protein